MKKVIYKFIWNYEKEEQWLNEMADQGWGLSRFCAGRYTFESSEQGKYRYRIELLQNGPKDPKSRSYLQFLKDAGITCIATSFNWVYLRKIAADGPFNMYSDIDSKITHYKRVNRLWMTLMVAELIVAVSNLLIGFDVQRLSWVNFSSCILLFILSGIFACLCVGLTRKIKRLESERIVHE
ncbi:DUF2812 domain-containing protein [Sporolactobacillus sp. STCC-11]|uniref:DUF2812 domain-containing protein n=1 Tax=Sporolactobacillus caesalpiniae TaxID=3230362 RepID=UPI0033995694